MGGGEGQALLLRSRGEFGVDEGREGLVELEKAHGGGRAQSEAGEGAQRTKVRRTAAGSGSAGGWARPMSEDASRRRHPKWAACGF